MSSDTDIAPLVDAGAPKVAKQPQAPIALVALGPGSRDLTDGSGCGEKTPMATVGEE